MKKGNFFKNLFITAMTVTILLSCSKDNLLDEKNDSFSNESTFTVSQEDALNSAKKFMKAMFETKTTKSINERFPAIVENLYPRESITKSSYQTPICYLINFNNNNGFVLISADKRTKDRVYFASEKGHLNLENLRKSPYSFLLDLIEKYQKRECSLNKITTKSDDGNYSTIETITSTTTKGPLLNTQWGQTYPYNYYINLIYNNYYQVGCPAVAMGQILAYYQEPSVISTGGINYTIDWNTITTQYPSDNWRNATSYLLYAIGDLVNMNYGIQISYADEDDVINGFNSIGATYSVYNDHSISHITSSLNNNSPVYIFGYVDINSIGHSWVIDGYKYLTVDVATYDENWNIVENTILNPDYNYTTYRRYWHCNLGFMGNDDGDYIYYRDNFIEGFHIEFIYSSIFDTSYGNFNNGIKLIYNISF